MSNWLRNIGKNLMNKQFSFDKYYNIFDWKKTVVGGSYALKDFTKANWKNNDIDVFVMYDSFDEFTTDTERISKELKGTITNQNPEYFNGLLGGSYTINTNNTNIQIIYIKNKALNESDNRIVKRMNRKPNESEYIPVEELAKGGPISILQEITDTPSVYFSYTNGKKIYHIPEKSLTAIETGVINENDIDPNRAQKYINRGYSIKRNEFEPEFIGVI
jgi:predicted nucleotidyltransferase